MSRDDLITMLSENSYTLMTDKDFEEFKTQFKNMYLEVYPDSSHDLWTTIEYQDAINALGIDYILVEDVYGKHYIYPKSKGTRRDKYIWLGIAAECPTRDIAVNSRLYGNMMLSNLLDGMKESLKEHKYIPMIGRLRVGCRKMTISEEVQVLIDEARDTFPQKDMRDVIHEYLQGAASGDFSVSGGEVQEMIRAIGYLFNAMDRTSKYPRSLEDVQVLLIQYHFPFKISLEGDYMKFHEID